MIVGIVGKPNVGKSTFFKALTLMDDVLIANYPFATINPNKGVGFVKIRCVEEEFNVKCNPRSGYCIDGWRFVPVEVVDVAGLIPGSHEGKGMGNKFLDDLRQADVLIHVVDISGKTNEKGETGKGDPVKDVLFLENELDWWYFQIIKRHWEKAIKETSTEKKELSIVLAKYLSGLNVKREKIKEVLKGLNKDVESWKDEELFEFAKALREITKPTLILANKIDVDGGEENLKKLKEAFPEKIIIPASAEAELALKEAAKKGLIKYIPGEKSFEIKESLKEKEKKGLEIIKKLVLDRWSSTGVQEAINRAVFDLLNYIAVFPVGEKLSDKEGNVLPDCFLMKNGSTALDLAFKIHEDFGKKFIKAIDARSGKTLGKDYVLKHRDVIQIVAGR